MGVGTLHGGGDDLLKTIIKVRGPFSKPGQQTQRDFTSNIAVNKYEKLVVD